MKGICTVSYICHGICCRNTICEFNIYFNLVTSWITKRNKDKRSIDLDVLIDDYYDIREYFKLLDGKNVPKMPERSEMARKPWRHCDWSKIYMTEWEQLKGSHTTKGSLLPNETDYLCCKFVTPDTPYRKHYKYVQSYQYWDIARMTPETICDHMVKGSPCMRHCCRRLLNFKLSFTLRPTVFDLQAVSEE